MSTVTKDVFYQLETIDINKLNALLEESVKTIDEKVWQSPIVEAPTREWASKADGDANANTQAKGRRKTRTANNVMDNTETDLAIRDQEGNMYRLEVIGTDDDIGPKGIQSVSTEYGKIAIRFAVKDNCLLGKTLRLLCDVLVKDTQNKVASQSIKYANPMILPFVRYTLKNGTDEQKSTYVREGNLNIYIDVPVNQRFENLNTKIFDNVEVTGSPPTGRKGVVLVDEKDASKGYIERRQIPVDRNTITNYITPSAGMSFWSIKFYRKTHKFGINLNGSLVEAYPIPRQLPDRVTRSGDNRSAEAIRNYAKSAAQRKAQITENAAELKRRAEEDEDDDSDIDYPGGADIDAGVAADGHKAKKNTDSFEPTVHAKTNPVATLGEAGGDISESD